MQLGRLLGRFLIDFGSKMGVLGGSWGSKNRSWEGSWGVLGGSWVPRAKKGVRHSISDTTWAPKLEPKSAKNLSEIDKKIIIVLNDFCIVFWGNLERSWANFDPKMAPSWHQVGFKIDPKRPSKSNWPTIAKTFKSVVLSSKIKGSRCQDRNQVGSKIDQKSIQKAIENKMQVGMDLGSMFGGSWVGFRVDLGPKLGPSWCQLGTKIH